MGIRPMADQQDQEGNVGIDQLPPDQLNQIKKQLEGEVEEFTKSIISLKYALGKYEESNESLAAITPENAGKRMLVPLTNSLYVPGSLGSAETVLVDIGTGYLVEKPPDKAKEFFQRKKEFCTENIGKVQQMLAMKKKNLEQVTIVLNAKVASQTGAQNAGFA